MGQQRPVNIIGEVLFCPMNGSSTFSKSGKAALYNTSNSEYGAPWAQDGIRAQKFDIRKEVVPTYSEIVNSMNDFKKAERLIKSKVIQQKLAAEGVTLEQPMRKTNQFPIKGSTTIQYPEHGLNVGPSIYRTNNMNYGSSVPIDHELPNKFHPCDSTFTKGFSGGNYKFNGLNTVKTVSKVHPELNDF